MELLNFVVTYRYNHDVGSRDLQRPVHRQWLADRFAAGDLMTSGPLASGKGAVLLWRARNEDELGRVLEDDPFAMHGLIAQTDIQEWVPVFGPWPEIGGNRSSG
jgi:uncharacterized protein YciI